MSDFISSDTKIDSTGRVTGTLNYVTGVTSFPEEEANGNFMPVTLDIKYSGKEITVKRNGGSEKTVADLDWLLRVEDNNTTFTFSTKTGGNILTLSFKGATLGKAS